MLPINVLAGEMLICVQSSSQGPPPHIIQLVQGRPPLMSQDGEISVCWGDGEHGCLGVTMAQNKNMHLANTKIVSLKFTAKKGMHFSDQEFLREDEF